MLNRPESVSTQRSDEIGASARSAAPAPIESGLPSLNQWLHRLLGLPIGHVRVRVRGNNLYILCINNPCPDQRQTWKRLIRGLIKTKLERFYPETAPQIYQVVLYGQRLGQPQPAWAEIIHLHQLPRYAAQLQDPTVSSTTGGATSSAASPLLLQARQGKPDAIARYLSESLSSFGIAVRASIKSAAPNEAVGDSLRRRLLIQCESAYSPDPALLAEPIAQKLRDLQLNSCRDALVFSQVQGEATPDWTLRVDLTPPTQMLRQRARWGDAAALLRLINHHLNEHQLQASGLVVDLVLHVTCWPQPTGWPDQATTVAAISTLIADIAPQGLHAATIYAVTARPRTALNSHQPAPNQPLWTHRLALPSRQDPALAESTIALAQQGNLGAIEFLLTQALNPDLDRQLAMGGIRIQARHRRDLLHVMVDGPVCPNQKPVVAKVNETLQAQKISGVNGLRIYGRRSGQSRPTWTEGQDWVHRGRLVPEAAPEFAASEAFVGDLIAASSGALMLRPDLSPDDLRRFRQRLVQGLQNLLLRSQIFTPLNLGLPLRRSASLNPQDGLQDSKVALVWGMVGVLMALSADWGMGLMLARLPQSPVLSRTGPKSLLSDAAFAQINLHKSGGQTPAGFNGSGFIRKGSLIPAQLGGGSRAEALPRGADGKVLQAAPLQPRAITDPNPATNSFNTPQLDEKLMLYKQYVAQSGVPDVLVVGSSRALRGIDPAALQEALSAQGYGGLKIFNFGINGSTAQVTELVIKRLIAPEQLPRLILWADGARAFNSGRPDATFNTIASSPGYAHLATLPGQPPAAPTPVSLIAASTAVADRYATFNQTLDQLVGQYSAAYQQRDRLAKQVRDGLFGPSDDSTSDTTSVEAALPTGQASGQPTNLSNLDVNGFLAISQRFNPVTYFQSYSRVTGANDADYSGFALQGPQAEALQSVATYAKSHKSQVVFINMPITAEYLDETRREHEDTFAQYMTQTAAGSGLTFRNLAESWKTQNDLFSDPSHLNRFGAYTVSQQLAKDPLVPWHPQKP